MRRRSEPPAFTRSVPPSARGTRRSV